MESPWGNNEDFQANQRAERTKLANEAKLKEQTRFQTDMLKKAELLSGFEPTVPYVLTMPDRIMLIAYGIKPE